MKTILSCFAVFLLLAACAGSPVIWEAGYKPGTYEGTGKGYRGDITVELYISSTGIEDIMIKSHAEKYTGLAAMEELLGIMLETGSAEQDAVSGATFSSRGFIEAVEDALLKAKR